VIARSVATLDALDTDPDLVWLCTWLPEDLVAEYGPERLRAMPIAENAMLGFAVGLAAAGLRPLVDIARAAFLFSAMDPLVNQATKLRYTTGGQYAVPLTVRALTRGGESLGAQHEHVPHAMLAQVPGLVVAVPSNELDAAGLLVTALTHPDPVVILESPAIFDDARDWAGRPVPAVPFGEAATVRHGDDLTVIGIGLAVRHALRAAEALAEDGIGVRVVDVRTVAPLDVPGLAAAAAATGRVLVVDEAPALCSAASESTARLLAAGAVPPSRIDQLNSLPVPAPFSPALQSAVFPGPEAVRARVLALLGEGPVR
jgi:pyruvate/2-oxoglutarate/acetoin dehydrogenase E1 component